VPQLQRAAHRGGRLLLLGGPPPGPPAGRRGGRHGRSRRARGMAHPPPLPRGLLLSSVRAPARPTPPEGPPSGAGGRERSFEAWSWLFMRISGVALVVLALLHFALTHLINDVAQTNSGFVSDRWHNPLW